MGVWINELGVSKVRPLCAQSTTSIISFSEDGLIMHVGNSEGNTNFL